MDTRPLGVFLRFPILRFLCLLVVIGTGQITLALEKTPYSVFLDRSDRPSARISHLKFNTLRFEIKVDKEQTNPDQTKTPFVAYLWGILLDPDSTLIIDDKPAMVSDAKTFLYPIHLLGAVTPVELKTVSKSGLVSAETIHLTFHEFYKAKNQF
ncbi:MAG: hypothetical protein HYX41_06700 [Bdellovibrio sp.]|nr:hypothetical protein [Bdellovibrio sp.]